MKTYTEEEYRALEQENIILLKCVEKLEFDKKINLKMIGEDIRFRFKMVKILLAMSRRLSLLLDARQAGFFHEDASLDDITAFAEKCLERLKETHNRDSLIENLGKEKMNKIEITHELLAKLKEAAQEANNYENSWGFAVAVGYMNTCTPSLILSLISSYEKLEKELDAARYSEAHESGRAVRLEREADWLAYMLANGDDCVRDACNDSSPCKMPDHELPYKEEYVQKYCKPCWRNAARKAIDDADNAMEAEQEARER